MFNSKGQQQKGQDNQQAGRDILNNTTHNHFDDDVGFDLVETEKIINDLYELSKDIETKEDFTYDRIKMENKNIQNKMEVYFEEKIKADIVYFSEIKEVLELNDEDFRNRFEYIIKTIRGAIIAIDSKEDLTPIKINKIVKQFYKQSWDFRKKERAERLIHFMYFICVIGKKERL